MPTEKEMLKVLSFCKGKTIKGFEVKKGFFSSNIYIIFNDSEAQFLQISERFKFLAVVRGWIGKIR